MSTEVIQAISLSLRVSLAATVLAALVGIPIGAWLASARLPYRRLWIILTNTLMATPTVLVGLLGYSLLSTRGLLGPLGLLYTPWAIILCQAIFALPLCLGLTRGAIETLDPRAAETARTLGAGPLKTALVLCGEAAPALMASTLGAFGRVLSELGIALMVGGNIRGETRTLTTAMALATQRGDMALGIELGLVLMLVALGVALVAEVLRR